MVKVFDYSVLFYWHATHTQIYRTLKEMEKDELVTGEVVHQIENPSKRIYSITNKGKYLPAESHKKPNGNRRLLLYLSRIYQRYGNGTNFHPIMDKPVRI